MPFEDSLEVLGTIYAVRRYSLQSEGAAVAELAENVVQRVPQESPISSSHPHILSLGMKPKETSITRVGPRCPMSSTSCIDPRAGPP